MNFIPAGQISDSSDTITAIVPIPSADSGRVTTMQVTDTATLVPAVALANRKSLSLVNLSNTEYLYIGFNNTVTADTVVGITSGWKIGPEENFNINITDAADLYGRTESGKVVLIQIMETAEDV